MASVAASKPRRSMQLLSPKKDYPQHCFWCAGECDEEPSPLGEGDMAMDADSDTCLGMLRRHFARGGRLTESAAVRLVSLARAVFEKEPNLLKLQAPMLLFGDVHGQYMDLVSLLDSLALPSLQKSMLMLGDYVDRGMFSTETMLYLCACKLCFPSNVYLLRGNHESRVMSGFMTFRRECLYKYGEALYDEFELLFDALPLAAVVTGTPFGNIFCVHGGIGPDLHKVEDIDALDRFHDIPESGLVCDLVWSDPVANWNADDPAFAYMSRGEWVDLSFAPNKMRRTSVVYGLRAVRTFLDANKLGFIVRGHQVQKSGFSAHFQYLSDIPRVLTLFGCPNYCDLYGNLGAFLRVSDSVVRVEQYKPVPHPTVLPDFIDVFSFSLPYMMGQISSVAKALKQAIDAEAEGSPKSLEGKGCPSSPTLRKRVELMRYRRPEDAFTCAKSRFEIALQFDLENEGLPSSVVTVSSPRRFHSMSDLGSEPRVEPAQREAV